MLTVNVGPLALAVSHVLLLVSLFLSMLTGWWLGRRSQRNPEQQLFRLLLVALVVARLSFVVVYVEYFRDEPWRVIDIRDGGFIVWPGILVAILWGVSLAWRDGTVRQPLGWAMAVGVLSWGLGSIGLYAFEQGTRLPDIGLRNNRGAPVALHEFVGRPLVVNLWATWCPPCRREMPVLAQAQRNEPEVTFLFVNQGEGAHLITEFLDAEGYVLENVLFDSGGRLGQHVGSSALPTTLFYDAQGRQIGSHIGELSEASLARALEGMKASAK